MISWMLAFLTLGAPAAADLPVWDEQFGCIETATAERYVRDFSIKVPAFGGMEVCRNDVETKKLFNDLSILEQGRFENPAAEGDLIRGFVPAEGYYSWLKSMTRGIDRGNDIPYATAYNRGGFFTMQDGWAQLSTLGRVGTVVHEARHTAGYRHYPCRQGSYAGASTNACDRDYASGGSHSVEMEYYARVVTQGRNFHPTYRSMARLMASARANFVFNDPVLRRREALLAREASSGELILFDDGRIVSRGALPMEGRLKRTSFGASFFDGARALALDLYAHAPSLVPDVYSYFKLLERTPMPLKDFEEFDVAERRYVVALQADDRLATFLFPRGDWGPWRAAGLDIARTTTALPDGRRGFFLITRDGAIHPYDATRDAVTAALPERWDGEIQAVALDRTQPITLHGEQLLIKRDNQWIEWPAAVGRRWTDLINVPMYDAFDVSP